MSGSGGLATSRQSSEAVLAPDADAPRAARDFAARTLQGWGVPQWAEPVGLVVSELVTNAVRHAGTPTTVRLVPSETGVVVEVEDGGPGEPRLLPPGDRTASGGLGLAIVDRLAQAWGCDGRADAGKTVWARLSLPESPWAGAPGAAPDPTAGPNPGGPAAAAMPTAPADQVMLELPFDKDMVGMVRSAVAHLAVRAGFQRREMEDLRLAADEIFALLFAQRPSIATTEAITCRFLVGTGRVGLTMAAAVPARRPPDVEDFGWHLLQALVDEIEWTAGDRTCEVRAEKRKGATP